MTTSATSCIVTPEYLPLPARVFMQLLKNISEGTVMLATPAGNSHHFVRTAEPYVELHLHDWSVCRQILQGGDIGFAEAYRDGKLSCSDIVAALSLALRNQDIMSRAIHGTFMGTLLYRLQHLLRRNTRQRARTNIRHHYDIGNDFYRLWLDETMTYSSALFSHPGQSLQEAQLAKYERLLDLVGAKPGDHILEIGCGWGAFAEYAARSRGCRVTGVSLSTEQLAWARRRIRGNAAEDLIEYRFQDYRDIHGRYDAIVSVEMLEAVGEAYWPGFFDRLRDLTKPGGRIGLQTITIADEHFEQYRRQTDFIQQYIFPGGMLPSPARLKSLVTAAGLQLLDVHDFGQDYAETLRRWRHRFESNTTAMARLGLDEQFVRLWRFYLCYCEAGFINQRTSVCQLLLET